MDLVNNFPSSCCQRAFFLRLVEQFGNICVYMWQKQVSVNGPYKLGCMHAHAQSVAAMQCPQAPPLSPVPPLYPCVGKLIPLPGFPPRGICRDIFSARGRVGSGTVWSHEPNAPTSCGAQDLNCLNRSGGRKVDAWYILLFSLHFQSPNFCIVFITIDWVSRT